MSQHSPIVLKLGIDAVYLAETERTFLFLMLNGMGHLMKISVNTVDCWTCTYRMF